MINYKIIPWFIIFILSLLAGCSSGSNSNPYHKISRSFDENKSVTPCSDFYQYACSKVESNFKLPENRMFYFFSFSDAIESVHRYKQSYLASLSQGKANGEIESNLRNFYLSCTDTSSLKKDEITFIKELKSELARIRTKGEMFDYLAKQVVSGRKGLIAVQVTPNGDDPSFNDLYFSPLMPKLVNIRDYEDPKIKEDYLVLITKLFSELGERNPRKIAEGIFQFEHALAQQTLAPEQVREQMNQKGLVSRKELLELKHLRLREAMTLVPDDTVMRNIYVPTLKWLNHRIESVTLNDLKYFYLYLNLKDVIDQSSKSYSDLRLNFNYQYLGGAKARRDRPEHCTIQTIKAFPMELDYLLLPKIFSEKDRDDVEKLAVSIKESLIAGLKINQWLSPSGKQNAISKIKNAELLLISPKGIKDWNFRPSTKMSSKKMVHNLIQLNGKIGKKELLDLGKRVSRTRWTVGPLDVNAYYEPSTNQFFLPAALLQTPFFGRDQSKEENLAGIGSLIGHELGHGIDDQGSRYDEMGRLNSWLTEADEKNFKKRTEPLVARFDKLGLNGKLTLGENIGDRVGLDAAFRAAFPDYPQKNYSKTRLQKFFLRYAHLWCEVQTPAFKRMRFSADPHAMGFARVNEQIRHQEGFQEAYDCKAGDPMVLPASQRMKIW